MTESAPDKPRSTYQSRLSEPLQVEIIARLISGQSKSRISRDLDVSRPTITNIEKNSAISSFVEDGKDDVLHMVPKCIRVVEEALESEDEGIRLRAAGMVLKSVGILSERIQIQDAVNPAWDVPQPARESSEKVN